jgi:predicted metal-dependent enzyme (double-stranded beta helix superfamily)
LRSRGSRIAQPRRCVAREDSAMFDLQRFVDECRAALAEEKGSAQRAAREVVARAVADPGALIGALGEPCRAGLSALHRAPDLTILNIVWGPHMTIMPHNHGMWAVIGIYGGAEDNIFWRRLPDGLPGAVEAAGAKSLRTRDATLLGRDIIHSVTNPLPRLTGAIHVYGGDFFAEERSEWDPETLRERPYDVEKAKQMFEKANAAIA